jgi:hypothetical protein
MSLDILAALEATPGTRGKRTCRIQRWLDSIEDGTAGKEALAATFTVTDPASPDYRTLAQLDAVANNLGESTSIKTIGDHRAKRCRCYA